MVVAACVHYPVISNIPLCALLVFKNRYHVTPRNYLGGWHDRAVHCLGELHLCCPDVL